MGHAKDAENDCRAAQSSSHWPAPEHVSGREQVTYIAARILIAQAKHYAAIDSQTCAVEAHRMLTHIRMFRVMIECPEEHAFHRAGSRLELLLSIGLEVPQISQSFKSEGAQTLLAFWSISSNGYNQSIPHAPTLSSTPTPCQRSTTMRRACLPCCLND